MEVRKYRLAKMKRKVITRLLLLFIFALLFVFGVVAAILFIRKQSAREAALTKLAFSASDQYVFTGSGFLYLSGGMLTYNDLTNEKYDYSAPVSASGSPVHLSASPTMHVLYNEGGLKIIGAANAAEFTGTLLSAACGNSHAAVLCLDALNKESIQVFSSDAQIIDQLAYSGQFILDYGFYTVNEEYLYVLTLSLDSGIPLSTITVYDLTNKSTTGIMQVQNQLLEKIYFTSGSIFAFGTNQLIRYGLPGNRESYREMVYGWKPVDFEASSSPSFLLMPRNFDTPGTVKLITLKEAEVAEAVAKLYQLPSGTIGAFIMGGKLVALTENGYTQYGSEKNEVSRTFDIKAESAQKLNSTTLLIKSGESMYLLKIA